MKSWQPSKRQIVRGLAALTAAARLPEYDFQVQIAPAPADDEDSELVETQAHVVISDLDALVTVYPAAFAPENDLPKILAHELGHVLCARYSNAVGKFATAAATLIIADLEEELCERIGRVILTAAEAQGADFTRLRHPPR